MELRHLRYFLAVAEDLHFGRAAERLHIAQPSLSQQIRRLELEIGADLFVRAHRRVELTAAGEALRAGAERTLSDVDAALRETRDAAAGTTGTLTVGFIETAAIRIVPQAVRRFRAARPEVKLILKELGVDDQIDDVLDGRLDIGFVRSTPSADGLVSETVLEEELVAAVPIGHRFAGQDSLNPEEIAGEPLITVERGVLPGLREETLTMLREHHGGPGIAQSATSVLAVLGLVASGLGLAVLPSSVTGLSLTGTRFVRIGASPRATILAIRREDASSPLIEPFLDEVRSGG